ncbi:hypothetical protein [Streptomyces sp. NPDC051561]|uniref:hypothetical protein n=1 Tax=Streptomyces sp. NPDC051561 TaxID=3365658 RepID=UPI0037A0A5D7
MTAIADRRAAREWKKARLVLELKRAASTRGIPVASDESLNRMIREWESGRRPLVGDYLELFCAVYGCSPAELGCFPEDAPEPELDEVSSLKRELLAARSVDTSMVKLFESQTENLRQMDRRLGAESLLPQIVAHVGQMEKLLQHGVASGARQLVAGALTEAAALAGWQALDLGRYGDAWNLHEVAKAAAREAGNSTLLAHATAQQAYVLMDLEQPTEAVQLVQQAVAHGEGKVPALMTTWLHAAEGEAHAVAGNSSACRRSLDRADASLPVDAADPELPFLFLAGSHLARWRGNCLARLGADEAIEDLSGALSAMDEGFNRAEAGVRCDLAGALLKRGDTSEATVQAEKARELAALTGSVRQRIRIQRILDLA